MTLVLSFVFVQSIFAQEFTFQTFKDRWVINSHSVEMLPKKRLDFRVTHRFGDLVGANGGWQTFFGLESVDDVLIGLEYGITDNFSVGLFRTKGAGNLKQLFSPTAKYRILRQSADASPISLTVVGVASVSSAEKAADSEGLNSFPKFAHRLVTNAQILVARKFSDDLSLQFSAGLTHRNLVPFGEENDIINVGLAVRYQLTKALGLIGDFTLPTNGVQNPFNESDGDVYSPIIGVGIEIETGGNVFQLNVVNAHGIMPTDYIPYTKNAQFGEGQFRLGFTISRMFRL